MPSTVQLPASIISPELTSGASTEPTGSASTISVFGEMRFMKRPMPVSVPPDPTPTTIASMSPSICLCRSPARWSPRAPPDWPGCRTG